MKISMRVGCALVGKNVERPEEMKADIRNNRESQKIYLPWIPIYLFVESINESRSIALILGNPCSMGSS